MQQRKFQKLSYGEEESDAENKDLMGRNPRRQRPRLVNLGDFPRMSKGSMMGNGG